MSKRALSYAMICLALVSVGCETMQSKPAPVAAPTIGKHPDVTIEGNDGTVLRGELMNGSVTIDCDQGQLTLLTDHIRLITFSAESDMVDSPSIKVSGKVMDNQFQLRSEHGVFTLMKERLRRISFQQDTGPLPPSPAPASAPTTHRSTRSADARN